MKKIIFLFLISLIPFSSNSQKVYSDEVTKDGTREILSTAENLYTSLSSASAFNLGLSSKDGETKIYLTLTVNEGKLTCAKGNVLLIKFTDGDIVELKNAKEIGRGDYSYRRTTMNTDEYRIFPSYQLTPEAIEKLNSKDVEKVRIQFNEGYIDKGTKKMAKKFRKMYQAIMDKLEKEPAPTIYDGF